MLIIITSHKNLLQQCEIRYYKSTFSSGLNYSVKGDIATKADVRFIRRSKIKVVTVSSGM